MRWFARGFAFLSWSQKCQWLPAWHQRWGAGSAILDTSRKHQIDHSPTLNAHKMATGLRAAWAFNTSTSPLFDDPEGRSGLLVDTSGSTQSIRVTLQRVLASFITGSNAQGKMGVLPKPGGMTAIVGSIEKLKQAFPECDTIFCITDGEENQFSGNVQTGEQDEDGDEITEFITPSTFGYLGKVAFHIEKMGVRLCVIGIGAQADTMVRALLHKKNVYVAKVEKEEPLRAIHSIVKTLCKMPDSPANSVTRGGVQHSLLIPLSEEVQADIERMEDLSEVEAMAPKIRFEGDKIGPPQSALDLKKTIEDVEKEFAFAQQEHKKEMNAALLLAMEAMCDNPVPGALLGGRYRNVVEMRFDGSKKLANQLMSRLIQPRILQKAGNVPDGGAEIVINGTTCKFAAKSVMYRCLVEKNVVQELATDGDFCIPRNQLKSAVKEVSPDSSPKSSPKRMREDKDEQDGAKIQRA